MSGGYRFDSTILREYDVRGIVGETLSTADAEALGKAVGTMIVRDGGKQVAVGRDGRLSSPDMAAAMAKGLASTGLTVLDIGLGPTPMLYFAVYHLDTDGGVMITGSHNPPDYNGFKMMRGKAALYGADIQALGEIAAAGDFEIGDGVVRQVEVFDDYVARLAQDGRDIADLNVVWDCGNGAAGEATEALVAKLPGRHKVLFGDIDGTFPNHHPDPTVPEYLQDLMAAVAEDGADLGIAFDGDGDRIGVIDAKGNVLWGDQLMVVLARDLLARRPGETVIADVKASKVLYDEIARAGGKPLMWKTGHSLIKTKMKELKAPLAGEMSGHIFFADGYYGYDDALYAAVRLLGALSRAGMSLDAIREALPKTVATPEIRFDCPEEKKFSAVEAVRGWVNGQDDLQVSEVDGVRVTTKDGWWLLRASNTQPVLVARAEAETEFGLNNLKSMIRSALEKAGLETGVI
ncbi:MAG: phosphomannomutase/phosphoglucomutase [Alphaproteobacteria bacterium]|nr:phosphomannomutase/phosphoglucomutase [Alphaproteobacteria bacterium]